MASEREGRLADLCRKVIDVHAQVVMDTPKDRELHDRAIAVFRAHLDLLAAHPPAPAEDAGGEVGVAEVDLLNLCNAFDRNRYDTHDWCLTHDVAVQPDAVCPVTAKAIAQAEREAGARAWDEGKHSEHTIDCRLSEGVGDCICPNPYREEQP